MLKVLSAGIVPDFKRCKLVSIESLVQTLILAELFSTNLVCEYLAFEFLPVNRKLCLEIIE